MWNDNVVAMTMGTGTWSDVLLNNQMRSSSCTSESNTLLIFFATFCNRGLFSGQVLDRGPQGPSIWCHYATASFISR